jgi:antitoxin component of MazEF toxin-antitoxin module
MVFMHARAKRVGNSWAIIVPKDKARELSISAEMDLHIEIEAIPRLRELKGTFKTKKSTARLMQEIDKGWD